MSLLAGQILHAEDIDLVPLEGENTVDVTTASTTYVFGATALSRTFTAPPSGRIKVQVYGEQSNNTASASSFLSFQIREGTAQSGALVSDPLDLPAFRTSGVTTTLAGAGRMTLVTGLVAGTTYTAWGRIRVTAGTGTWLTTSIFVEPTL